MSDKSLNSCDKKQLCKSCISLLVIVVEERAEVHVCRAAVESALTFSMLLQCSNMTAQEKILLERDVCTVNLSLLQPSMTSH